MSATWTIYSPLAPQRMRSLEEECDQAVEEYLEEHPDCDDQCGEVLADGQLPDADEVTRGHERYRLPLPAAILERLAGCRSAMTIDRPGDLDGDPLQVSVLRFLLERAGEALVMLNDYPLRRSEELLAEIAQKPGAAGFLDDDDDERGDEADEADEADEEDEPRSAPPRSSRQGGLGGLAAMAGGQERAARLEQILNSARDNPELSIEVIEVLRKTPDLGRRYAALLMEEGAMPDAMAARSLNAPRDEITAAADALDRALRD